MTPDEIRVAIRMLGQPVYWQGEYPVEYTESGYIVNLGSWYGRSELIFDKDGEFRNGGLGRWSFRAEDFGTECKPSGINPR
jgi:hypothetical protein